MRKNGKYGLILCWYIDTWQVRTYEDKSGWN